ncbi:glycosyltransferase [Fontibacter flavus]|uniref:Glycosyltransferase n=1 Tax=Fontibacter flavus TaxID=654838 RepID=A0ABV6FUR6_9BACT
MIPKIIHYCWFGPSQLSDLEKACMESWMNVLPDYTIKRWDEHLFDVNSFEFTREAYRLGKYAFVSDVCRLHALYEEGGIYLDTDMMVIKEFSPLLDDPFFIGEEKEGLISAGIIGCELGNHIVKNLLEGYMELFFDFKNPLDIPRYLTSILKRNEIKIYPKDYFYSLPFKNRGENFKRYTNSNSFAVHLWNYSWKDEWAHLHEKEFKIALKKYFQRVFTSPKTVWKDSFLVDFLKYFLASKFGLIYRIYKNQS